MRGSIRLPILPCLAFLAMAASGVSPAVGHGIGVVVSCEVRPSVVEVGRAIPLRVVIENRTGMTVDHMTFALEPNGWGGETMNLDLVDVYRDGAPGGLVLAGPEASPPLAVAGVSRHAIVAGASLVLRTEAARWTIKGGWAPGRYQVTVRIRNLRADPHTTLWVSSDPCAFTVH